MPARRTSAGGGAASGWERQLEAYVRAQGGTPGAQRTARMRLADAVRVAPQSPEAWWALLAAEEAGGGGSTATLDRTGAPARGGISLFDLYGAATRAVPRQGNYGNECFVRIWLGFARQQWARNADDARDVLKMLKSQHIGETSAALYYEWAALELAGGNQFKALGVLSKGLKERAQPASLLEQMHADVQAGKFAYQPPWGANGTASAGAPPAEKQTVAPAVQTHDQGNRTGHSGASSLGAAFLTPGVGDERRNHSATPTLEMVAGSGATDTLVINRAPAARQGSNLAPRPADSGRRGSGGGNGGDTETVVLGSKAAAAPAASQQQQHTAGLTDQLANRTSHTMHSGSTVGSDDPTATMRMKTPAAAGLSHRSGGSTGSLGEEATVSLRKPGSADGAAADQQHASGSSGDETLVINRSARLKDVMGSAGPKDAAAGGGGSSAAGKDAAPQPLLKPRRLGVLGKAQRVVSGSAGRPPLAPAAAAEQQQDAVGGDDAAAAAAAAEANRKRKAEIEAAHSPKPLLSVGEGKRRQSPCADEVKPASRTAAAAGAAAAPPRPAERQLPPVPRFDEQRPAAASRAAAAEVVTTAAPNRRPLAAVAGTHAATASRPPVPAAPPAARPQQVVLREGGAAGRSGRDEEEDGEEDETAPVVLSKLAQRVQRGRQSLAPSKIVLGGDGSLLHRSSAGIPGANDGDDDEPTLPVGNPPATAAAAASDDADATRPLARAPSSRAASPLPQRPAGPRVQIDSAGNVAVTRAGSASIRTLPVPPAPPPALAAAAPAPAARVPMGPPPPKPARAAAPAAQHAARPGRRVVEDENTVTVKDICYTKLECVGRGGSSKVYKVMAPNRKIFALKRIRLQGRDAEAASGFLDEIKLLNSLAGRSNIIQLIDSEVHRSEGLIYMVLEYGDIDLARLLQKHEKARREKAGGVAVEEIDENFTRLYWEQMLQAVDTIHHERIVHSDLKPANFLVVEGQLKLIDFGIAKAIQSDTTSIARESQVGTLNYMSPEAILGGQNNIRGGPPMKVGRASDIWSLGCILYQMVYGHTPFSHMPFIQKMHAIIDSNHRVAFPPIKNAALLDVIQRCLDRNPRSRITMQELLEHPFLRPTHAPAPAPAKPSGSSVELSREQLTKLLQQVAAAGMSGGDVGHLSDTLFKQLASGLSPDLVSRKAMAAEQARSVVATQQAQQAQAPQRREAAAPAAQALPQQARAPAPPQPQQPGSVAAAAAQAAGARAGQRADAVAALESRPRAAAAPAACTRSGRAALMPISQTALQQQAASLRRVDPAQKAAPAARQPDSGLEAALRKGLERFKFEDAIGGGDEGNTTGGFGDL
ncbi:hypothetical protein C2E20_3077 [Micractinium conductrix]|uniref:Protein kinase domain-containing protein n=1 Tax=Micractinium conductrix TaxID=554055 RepID=A0A2P6VHU2_9CHLO|nr:hypothetical protein C2E20_3077 [Micractinium conductrix]|eukprot:PSC73666.1 hypothetical protein C2E20_3077 [Micractinium conductrix]